jgi:hypothetical protein
MVETRGLQIASTLIGPVWDDFASVVEKRISRFSGSDYDFTLSEENFRLDFAVSLARRLDYPNKVFAEYPCDKASSQKLDLFVDEPPGVCLEFKFFRPIPSGLNPPMTQHLGSLWADVVKLATLCKPDRIKFLVVFADARFVRYFQGQGVIPSKEGARINLSLSLGSAPKTLVATLEKRLPHTTIPKEIHAMLEASRVSRGGPFSGYLLSLV